MLLTGLVNWQVDGQLFGILLSVLLKNWLVFCLTGCLFGLLNKLIYCPLCGIAVDCWTVLHVLISSFYLNWGCIIFKSLQLMKDFHERFYRNLRLSITCQLFIYSFLYFLPWKTQNWQKKFECSLLNKNLGTA